MYPCEAQSPVPLWQLVLQETVGVGSRVLPHPPPISSGHLQAELSGGGEFPASRIPSLCYTQTPSSAHSWGQRHQAGRQAVQKKEVEVTLQLPWALAHCCPPGQTGSLGHGWWGLQEPGCVPAAARTSLRVVSDHHGGWGVEGHVDQQGQIGSEVWGNLRIRGQTGHLFLSSLWSACFQMSGLGGVTCLFVLQKSVVLRGLLRGWGP